MTTSCESLMEAAMEMYGLSHYDIIHEKSLESRVQHLWTLYWF